MDVEQVLELFDLHWFHRQILAPSTPPPPPTPILQIPKESPKLAQSSRHVRSLSDQSSSQTSFTSDSSSPKSVLAEYKHHKLSTILSGREQPEERSEKLESIRFPKQSRRNRVSSRSLSELEIEELKGFMDLGFVFSEEDRNSSLVSIIPGLQRLGNGEGEERTGEEKNKDAISRPYLSEAWAVMNRNRKIESQFAAMNWRFPSLSNESDMKLNLRSWAHSVASAVRV